MLRRQDLGLRFKMLIESNLVPLSPRCPLSSTFPKTAFVFSANLHFAYDGLYTFKNFYL